MRGNIKANVVSRYATMAATSRGATAAMDHATSLAVAVKAVVERVKV